MIATFKISNEMRKAQLEEGNVLPEIARIEIDFSDLPKADRRLILRHSILDGNVLYVGYDQKKEKAYLPSYYPFEIKSGSYDSKGYHATLDAYDLETLLHALREYSQYRDVELPKKQKAWQEEARKEQIDWLDTDKALSFSANWKSYEDKFQTYKIPSDVQSKFKKRWETYQEEKQERKKAEAAEKEAWRKAREEAEAQTIREREAWISKHGSDCLKKMLKGDYELRMSYELERAAKEYPGFELDTAGDRFDWEKRANPSCEALEAAEKSGGKVVWLTRDKNDEPQWEDYAAREAIKIEPDWSRYALIQPVS